MLRHGGHTGCAAKACGTKKAGQLGQGVLKGAVAVHGHQDGARPAAVHLPKAFGGRARHAAAVGRHRHQANVPGGESHVGKGKCPVCQINGDTI